MAGGEFGITLKPGVDVGEAEKEINDLVQKGVKAIKNGNLQVAKEVDNLLTKYTGKQGKAEIETILSYKADTGGLKLEKQITTQNLQLFKKKAQVEQGSLQNLKQRLAKEVQSRNNIQQLVTRTGALAMVLKTQVNPEWDKANKKVIKLQQEVNKLSNMGGSKGGALGKVLSVGNKFQQVVGGFTAVGVAMQGVNAAVQPIIGRQKDIQALKLTLEGVGVTVAGQNAVLKSASAVSLKYGQSLQKIEGAYKRLTPAILEQGGTLSDTEKAIETISARTTSLGLNTEQTGRYIEAFAQVMGKGKLQGEELNQQFSELDGALRGQLKSYFAASEGVTDFEEAMRNGEITSQKFLVAINEISAGLRDNMAREAQNAQKGIESLGEKGGLTINQLNAQMQSLTKLGLGAISKPLAPLGKALARIYAAFVQIFTKIATEMPGVQKFFTVLSKVVGDILEVGLNATLILFAKIVEMFDWLLVKLDEFVQFAMELPIVGDAFRAIGDSMNDAMENLRNGIDDFSQLSEETTGATGKLGEFDMTAANLKRQLDEGKVTQEEYNDAINKLETQEAQRELQELQAEAERTKAKLESAYKEAKQVADNKKNAFDEQKAILDAIGQGLKDNIDIEIEGNKAAMESIRSKASAQKRAIDDTKRAVKDQTRAVVASLDAEKGKVKERYEAERQEIDRNVAAIKSFYATARSKLNSQKSAVNSYYDKQLAGLDRLEAKMTAAHDRRMSQIERQRDAAVGAIESEIQALESLTPAEAALAKLRREELMRTAQDPNASQKERLEAVAQLEREQRNLQIAEARKRIKAEEERAAEAARKEEERHKKQMEEIENRRQQMEIRRTEALEKIARQMEEQNEKEKQAIEEEKKKKQELADQEKKELEEIERKKKEAKEKERERLEELEAEKRAAEEAAKEAIEELKKKNQELQEEKKRIDQRIKDAITSEQELGARAEATERAFYSQVVRVGQLNDELRTANFNAQTLLNKLNAAKDAAARVNSGPPNAFSGGPVAGGDKRIVNELGQEGFLSASGKLTSINAPAWGEWRAPSSGTIIPAHIFSQLKAQQGEAPMMPAAGGSQVSGTAGIARALSSLSQGDNITNNVTIQAANTTQAASDMLVNLTKVRNRRYR